LADGAQAPRIARFPEQRLVMLASFGFSREQRVYRRMPEPLRSGRCVMAQIDADVLCRCPHVAHAPLQWRTLINPAPARKPVAFIDHPGARLRYPNDGLYACGRQREVTCPASQRISPIGFALLVEQRIGGAQIRFGAA
jgi:hypothetical protein